MIQIIVLIFLARYIGELARKKGHTVWKWRLATVLAWFALEIPVILFSFGYSGNILVASLSGFLAGLLSFFILKTQLDKMPGQEKE